MTDLASAAQPEGAEVCGSVVIECPVIKTEQKECLICTSRTGEQCCDVFWTETREGHSPLMAYVCRVAEVRLAGDVQDSGAVVCRTCVELINVLERVEIEYFRLKDSFIAIIASNPSFESTACRGDVKEIVTVKHEVGESAANQTRMRERKDSDDEPLALRKKRRKSGKQKKDVDEENGVLVKTEDDVCQQILGLPSQPESDDNFDWPDAPELSDNEFTPPVPTLRRKNRSLENGPKQRNSKAQKRRSICIPVIGDIPIEFIGKRNQKSDESKQKRVAQDVKNKKKRNDNKSQKHRCKECAAEFNSMIRLEAHMAKHEAVKGPFICEICGAHYKHKKACDIHVAMHKGISDWKCEECNKIFPSKGALHRHNAIHTGKANYQCDLCGKSFIHTSSFKMHKLSHTGLKPHKCDVCGLALMTRSHLKRHKRIHSGEKRHECSLCGKRFSERYNLLAHHKSHTLDESATAGPTKRVWQGFRCHLCDKRFERRYMLEKHMEVVHQRIMEKGPPKPRNTMTKLLKAQAAAAGKVTVRPDPEHTRSDQGTQIDSSILQNLLNKDATTPTSAASVTAVDPLDVKPHIVITQSEDTKTSVDKRPQPSTAQTPASSEFYALCLGTGGATLVTALSRITDATTPNSSVSVTDVDPLHGKPHIVTQSEDTKTSAEKRSQSSTAQTPVSSGEGYDGLRLPNGTWSSGTFVPTEYTIRINEFQQ